MSQPDQDWGGSEEGGATKKESRLKRWIRKAWWVHSLGALAFGVGVMLFARKGLAYADKILIGLGISWLLMFVAVRFIVGPQNRKPDENTAKKGLRVVTNYIIKQFYQQIFFFLTPVYFFSATWQLQEPALINWWIVPLLFLLAVLSTLDLVFDRFIMERRWIASIMYGVGLFAVMNLLFPMLTGHSHFWGLMLGAAVTPISIALLSLPIRQAFSKRGLIWITVTTCILATGVFFARNNIPPVPISMRTGGIGHGSHGSYECLPGKKTKIESTRLDGLRCVTSVTAPGGVLDDLEHVWSFEGKEVHREQAMRVPECDEEGLVYRTFYSPIVQSDPVTSNQWAGRWSCRLVTPLDQIVGMVFFEITVAPTDDIFVPVVDPPRAVEPTPAKDAGQ